MATDSSASIVSKVPPSPRLRRTGGNYPPSLSKLWRTGAHVLKNAGVGYGDCIEQITYLLFLKPASETPWTQDLWIYDPPHQSALHPQDQPARQQRPRRLQSRLSAQCLRQAQGNRALQEIHLRRDRRERQSQPRHPLAQGRQPRRQRKPPSSRPVSCRDRGEPRSRPRRVPRGGGGIGAQRRLEPCKIIRPNCLLGINF